MPADVPRTIAKIGSAATRMVMKTSEPIRKLHNRSLSGRRLTAFEEPRESEFGCELRKAIPTHPTLFRANYGFASTRPKIATALLQAVHSLTSGDR
jgi:hypothetical protein